MLDLIGLNPSLTTKPNWVAFMIRRRVFSLACCALMLAPALAAGQFGQVISPLDAERANLVVEWTTSAQIDPASARISGSVLHVSSRNAETRFELTYGARKQSVSEFDIGPDGRLFGVEGAQAWIETTAEIIKDTQGVETSIRRVVKPKITFYLTASNGLVQAIDANSGATIWSAMVGKPALKTSAPAANEDFVCVFNGSTLYCLDAETGRPLWDNQCRNAPTSAPVINGENVFVSLVNGFIEVYPLRDPDEPKEDARELTPTELAEKERIDDAVRFMRLRRYGQTSIDLPTNVSTKYFVSSGGVVVRPTLTPTGIAWNSLNREFYLGHALGKEVGKVRHALKIEGMAVSPPAYQNGVVYLTTDQGFIYSIREETGAIEWATGIGEPISQSATPMGSYVYVVTDGESLMKLDKSFGAVAPRWPARIPNVRSIVSVSKDRLYCIDSNRNLVAISKDSGARLAVVPAFDQDYQFVNIQSDRIYLGTSLGTIQCLREQGLEEVYLHGDDDVDAETGPKESSDFEMGGQGGEQGGEEELNPFKEDKPGETNPFDAKPKDEVNPFDK